MARGRLVEERTSLFSCLFNAFSKLTGVTDLEELQELGTEIPLEVITHPKVNILEGH